MVDQSSAEYGPMGDRVEAFIQSALFSKTFKEGMALVEETANYLDGDGREISKSMGRSAALAYAGCSMRLTTQLMQIASWLLVLRAMREGDMTVAEASDPKYRLHQRETVPGHRLDNNELPEMLVVLIKRADRLHERIARLDAGLFSDEEKAGSQLGAVAQQQALLRAFNGQ
ncbi:MAG: DUF1465 family protein [Pseudomonadota bacterium]